MLEQRLTEPEVLAYFAQRPESITHKKLKTYALRGLIDRPQHVHERGRRGSASYYNASVLHDLERLEAANRSGSKRSITSRGILAWLEQPSATAAQNCKITEQFRSDFERFKHTNSSLTEMLLNPPDSGDNTQRSEVDLAFRVSETLTDQTPKHVQPLREEITDVALVKQPLSRISNKLSRDEKALGIIDNDTIMIPDSGRLKAIVTASYSIGVDDQERARLMLRRIYNVLKSEEKRGVSPEYVTRLSAFCPIGMVKVFLKSIDQFVVKVAPVALIWLANEYRVGNSIWLSSLEKMLTQFEQQTSAFN